jgi:hypothetical protein
MKTNFDVSQYKRPRITPPQPEWGDVRDVQRQFGLKETHTYQLMREGRIKFVLIRGRGKSRGKTDWHRVGPFAQLVAISTTEKLNGLLKLPQLRKDAFLDACKIRITELQKTLGAVLGLPAEDAHVYIERVFSEVLASREVARLVQVKGFKAWEQERRLGGGEA